MQLRAICQPTDMKEIHKEEEELYLKRIVSLMVIRLPDSASVGRQTDADANQCSNDADHLQHPCMNFNHSRGMSMFKRVKHKRVSIIENQPANR